MTYRAAADVVVFVHFAFVLFVVLGGFLAIRWPRLAWVHLPAAVWGAAIEFAGWACPLTPLEQRLRRMGGESGYEGGFVEHYIVSLLYPGSLTRSMQLALGAAVIVINAIAYAFVIRRLRQRRRAVATPVRP